MRRTTLILLALTVALASVSSAAARRKPNGAESKQIRAAVKAFIARPGAPSAGSRVERIRVSTVNRRYAMAKLDTGFATLGTALLKRHGSRWRVVTYGLAGFAFRGVPVLTINDLLGGTLCHCHYPPGTAPG